MGDATSFHLPPGCRFYPSEDHLLSYYLSLKTSSAAVDRNGYDLIRELNLYDYDPFDLPDYACYAYGRGGRRWHWYCYTVRVAKERRTRSGYWRRKGRVTDVVGGGGKAAVVGRRSSFVFYLGDKDTNAVRTDWVLYQYALLDHLQGSFVVCRVFVRSPGGANVSENGLSSCAEGSVSTVRHVGIQCDGFCNPRIVPEIDGGKSVPRNTDKSKDEMRPKTEVDKQVVTRPASCNQTNRQVPMLLDGLSSEHLLSLIEGDFIELDDLID